MKNVLNIEKLDFIYKIKNCKLKISTKGGYTLLEAVIYTAVFAVLSVIAVNAILLVTGAFLDVRADRAVNHSAINALDRLMREVRLADEINITESTFDASPGKLSLSTTDSSGSAITREFVVENGRLYMEVGGVRQGPLTGESIVVDTLIFRLITHGSVQAIKMEAVLYDDRVSPARERNFYNTATLRGTY